MNSSRLIRLLLPILFVIPTVIHAGSYDGRPKILLHAVAPTFKSESACAVGRLSLTDCTFANTTAAVDPESGYFVYLVAEKGGFAGLAGFYCGLTYQGGVATGQNDGIGIDIFQWQLCGTQELTFGSPWPAPQTGNMILFSNQVECPAENPAIGGWFYLAAYSPDKLNIIKRPIDSLARVAAWRSAACDDFDEYNLDNHELGSLHFSANSLDIGCNPCLGPCPIDPTTVQARTWGSIKNIR